ncbi:ABC transporter ATP-binding protein [Emergencia sp.]|uniref:ABC transporter ATP-binding protein n=1 Tax=Emergencia sp. TaxID=1926557 RepID=UPI003AF0DD8C
MIKTDGPLLEVNHIKKYFPVYGGPLSKLQGYVHAVDDVSFSVDQGETFGLVGESGCGKSTLMQTIMRLTPATSGSVTFDGKELFTLKKRELRNSRKEFQIIYQDPFSSLNPRMTIGEMISEPLLVHGVKDAEERKRRTLETMANVGLQESFYDRYPHEFSGGQRQRVSIARSLILKPKLILCDEPVSALDVSIQSQILNLLKALREKYGLTYIFVSHALNVVRHLSNRICVMYLGKIVEIGKTEDIFNHSLHPYTKALVSAIPVPDPSFQRNRILLKGDVASPKNPPKGCRFHTRCPFASQRCMEEEPALTDYGSGHQCACFLNVK